MNAKLSVVVMLAAACAACSNQGSAPTQRTPVSTASPPVASSPAPATSAIPMTAPAGSNSSEVPIPAPADAPSLDVILKRPSFAKAFATMQGAASLPEWVRGASAPSARVQVAGEAMWLSHVCQSADCRGDQVFVLTDPSAHTMVGLFVQASGSADASVQRLTWLGKPDAAIQTYLKAQIAAE